MSVFCRFSSISLIPAVHQLLGRFAVQTQYALQQFKPQQPNAPLRLINAVIHSNMEMEVGHQAIMSLIHFILMLFLGIHWLLTPQLSLSLGRFSNTVEQEWGMFSSLINDDYLFREKGKGGDWKMKLDISIYCSCQIYNMHSVDPHKSVVVSLLQRWLHDHNQFTLMAWPSSGNHSGNHSNAYSKGHVLPKTHN